jgi:hypothetical protein
MSSHAWMKKGPRALLCCLGCLASGWGYAFDEPCTPSDTATLPVCVFAQGAVATVLFFKAPHPEDCYAGKGTGPNVWTDQAFQAAFSSYGPKTVTAAQGFYVAGIQNQHKKTSQSVVCLYVPRPDHKIASAGGVVWDEASATFLAFPPAFTTGYVTGINGQNLGPPKGCELVPGVEGPLGRDCLLSVIQSA